MSRILLLVALLLTSGAAWADRESDKGGDVGERQTPADATADEQAETNKSKDAAKEISGMSILGNQEAPKSLVIVPWKSSVLGDSLGISTMLDDSRQPIDKEVFMRSLKYYEIRSETRP